MTAVRGAPPAPASGQKRRAPNARGRVLAGGGRIVFERLLIR